MASHTGPYPLEGVRMPTWLLRFDKHAACTSPVTREQLLHTLRNAPPSDLIFFSHGWNNDFDEAAELYARFLRHFEAHTAAHPVVRANGVPFTPLFVGVVWPSIWLSFDSGPQIAAAVEPPASDSAVVEALIDKLADLGSEASIERVYALLALPRLDETQALELASLIGPAFGTVHDEETGIGARGTSVDELLSMWRAMQQAQDGGSTPAPSLDDWGVPPADAAESQGGGAAPLETAGLFSFLDPRNALRLFSVYQMKDRAGLVGARGVAPLLRDVLQAAPAVGVHAVGHSYGCKVMLSAVCAPASLPRPLSSLLLLQPAVSHLSFADDIPRIGRPGGYRASLTPERVRPPILSTYSRNDFALHETFHLALRRDSDLGEQPIDMAAGDDATSAGKPPSNFAALGGYGPRRAGQRLIDPMPAAGAPYPDFAPAHPIVGLDGSQGLIGGHGDVTSPATAWALYRLVTR
ncbi:hypothetical protein M3A49_22065 [Paraburkholderia sp. CNPSo 3076]|uniref:hypothetical protein n=1 Tax=Paraburkholderia sp. CNPSo 3076 TaxID=2940936 RepID=UPI00225A8F94|nr:hypothetical protein [Paraburkholderia sp. CNPSo 3076]MCX5542153.1 hypothetical protein [Paraburkholderia sp. CNPSo 3076]